jgi:hypothetical protein
VKSSLVTRIVEHWGLTLKRRRQRSISGVYDGMLRREGFLDLSNAFPGYNELICFFKYFVILMATPFWFMLMQVLLSARTMPSLGLVLEIPSNRTGLSK